MTARAVSRQLTGALLAATIALFAGRPSVPPTVQAAAPALGSRATLRVGLWTLWHDRELKLTPGKAATFRTCETCVPRPLANTATLRAGGNNISFFAGGAPTHSTQILIAGSITLAAHGETVTLHNPLTINARNGTLIIAVTLPVENYVERVVASESSPADSAESLKALAIVVRTYALHESHGHFGYDLCDTTHCQHLRWSAAATAPDESATLATAGETLWFHGHRALAYFSKDCGGQTASPSEIWPRAVSATYLPSRPDPYCARLGSAEWDSELSYADLSAATAAYGLAATGWEQLIVSRRAPSGRALALRLGNTEISAEDFRIAIGESLGWNKVPSTWFEVTRQGDRFLFHGRGWGHGVGLCQKGAAAMAAQNQTSRDILSQYFPGAESADETTGIAWKTFVGSSLILETLDAADAAYLPQLERARAEASQRSGLNASARFTVRAFASTSAFRDTTLSPGWIAAFTRGDWIASQPLRTLAARHLLAPTMRHEFLHALIERESTSATPLWLREGLAETWGEDRPVYSATIHAPPAPALRSLDNALAHATSETESRAAHLAAGWYAARLLERFGRNQVLAWLRSGVPASALAVLGQR